MIDDTGFSSESVATVRGTGLPSKSVWLFVLAGRRVSGDFSNLQTTSAKGGGLFDKRRFSFGMMRCPDASVAVLAVAFHCGQK